MIIAGDSRKGCSTCLHDFHLCGGGEQLGEASLQSLPAHADVLALVCQQLDEGGQQLQVAGRRHLCAAQMNITFIMTILSL